MVVLYHCMDARSFRPLWMLEELGQAYDLIMLPFPPRFRDRAYLQLNPLGTVPLMIDGETRMTESSAICQYLCARDGPTTLQVEPGESDFGAFLNFLHFGEATLTFPQTLVRRYARFEPDERQQPQVVEDYSRWFLSRLRTLEPRLLEQEHLCAGRFTAADVSVGYALLLADHIGLGDRFKPAIAAYWRRLQARPAFSRALAAQTSAARAQGVSPISALDSDPTDHLAAAG